VRLFKHIDPLPSAAGEQLSFWEVALRCRAAGDLLIGFKPHGALAPVMNPEKKTEPRGWHPMGLLVVITQGE
jgi:hypothetical protein